MAKARLVKPATRGGAALGRVAETDDRVAGGVRHLELHDRRAGDGDARDGHLGRQRGPGCGRGVGCRCGIAGDDDDAGAAQSGGSRRAGRAGRPSWTGCASGAYRPVAAAASCNGRRQHSRQRQERPARRSSIPFCPTRSVHGCSPSSFGMETGVLHDASLTTAIFLPALAVDLFQIKIAANCVVRSTHTLAPARSSKLRTGWSKSGLALDAMFASLRPVRPLPVQTPIAARRTAGPRTRAGRSAYLLSVASSIRTA